ncbi:DMT family transporter [Streptomyces zingiberis]
MVAVAIVFEVVATLALRASHGFTRLGPSAVVVVGYLAAFWLLAQALKSLDVGPVYAVWSGIGTVGAFIGGVLLFGEQVRVTTVIGAALIVIGVIVMNAGGGLQH